MIECLFYNLFVGMGKGTTEKRGVVIGGWKDIFPAEWTNTICTLGLKIKDLFLIDSINLLNFKRIGPILFSYFPNKLKQSNMGACHVTVKDISNSNTQIIG
jgi:hypothetical protein